MTQRERGKPSHEAERDDVWSDVLLDSEEALGLEFLDDPPSVRALRHRRDLRRAAGLAEAFEQLLRTLVELPARSRVSFVAPDGSPVLTCDLADGRIGIQRVAAATPPIRAFVEMFAAVVRRSLRDALSVEWSASAGARGECEMMDVLAGVGALLTSERSDPEVTRPDALLQRADAAYHFRRIAETPAGWLLVEALRRSPEGDLFAAGTLLDLNHGVLGEPVRLVVRSADPHLHAVLRTQHDAWAILAPPLALVHLVAAAREDDE